MPEGELRSLADRLKTPLFRLQAVASFYPHFFLKPPARAEVRVCGDMACHRRGGNDLRERLIAKYRGQDVNIHHVSCLGRCDFAPAIAVNDQIFEHVSDGDAAGLIDFAAAGASSEQLAERRGPPRAARLACDPYPDQASQYGVLKSFTQSKDFAGLITTLKASGLRGLGGAGFPTGIKWELVRKKPGPEKYVVCNADESEPGTIKDRFILTNLPHLVIEGMIVAGLTVGARKGILYIRHEYERPGTHPPARDRPLLSRRDFSAAACWDRTSAFDLEIFVSPGGYICGEETALMEAIEGKRAEPRNKPPFPGQVGGGLWGKPTALNNVETFAYVPQILANGVDWMQGAGRERLGRREVRRRQRRRRQSGRLRSPDGHVVSGADRRVCRRRPPGTHAQGVRAVGARRRLPARVDARSAARLELGDGGRRDGRLGRDRRLRRRRAACSTWR